MLARIRDTRYERNQAREQTAQNLGPGRPRLPVPGPRPFDLASHGGDPDGREVPLLPEPSGSTSSVVSAQQNTRSILASVDHPVMARGVPPSSTTVTPRRRAPQRVPQLLLPGLGDRPRLDE